MRDNSGNWIVLVEPKDYTEADVEGFNPTLNGRSCTASVEARRPRVTNR
jgi:hypothetical protein